MRMKPWQPYIHRFVSSPAITRILSRVVTLIDRPMLEITQGYFSPSGFIAGWPVIHLTTIGAKTGLKRSIAVLGIPEGDEIILIASNFAKNKNPSWYYNLKKNPTAWIRSNGKTRMYLAREADPDNYDHYWNAALNAHIGYDSYRQRSTRKIPILILSPADEPAALDKTG